MKTPARLHSNAAERMSKRPRAILGWAEPAFSSMEMRPRSEAQISNQQRRPQQSGPLNRLRVERIPKEFDFTKPHRTTLCLDNVKLRAARAAKRKWDESISPSSHFEFRKRSKRRTQVSETTE